MLAYGVAMLDRTILFLMVAPLEHDLNISDTQMGLLQGFAFALFFAAAGIPIGRLADRTSRPRLIGIGIMLWSVMTACSGLARSFWHLVIARMGVGIGEATLSPATYSLLADLFPKDRLARATALFSAGSLIGSGAAFVFGGALLDALASRPDLGLPFFGVVRSWQIAFLVAGLPGIAVGLMIFAIPEPRRLGTPRKATAPIAELLHFLLDARRPLTSIVSGFSCQTLIIYSTLSWGPTLLIRNHHVGTAKAGEIMGVVVAIFGLAGFLTGGALADHLVKAGRTDGHMRVAIIGALGYGPFAVALSLAHSLPATVISMCLMFFFVSLPTAAGVAALQLVTPSHLRAQVSSVFLLCVNLIGLGFGSFLVGSLTDHVFKSKSAIGLSLLTTYAAAIPIMVGSFWCGRSSVGAWIERQDSARPGVG
jgi:MFS family permease